MNKYYEKMLKADARQKAKDEKKSKRFYQICKKYNKSLPELTKDELTKSEYKYILGYLEYCKFKLHWYPNLENTSATN